MAFVQRESGGVCRHTSTVLEEMPGVIHGFSTRLGGISEGLYFSLNFRSHGEEHDDPTRVRENYRRFCAAIGVSPDSLVLSSQVHEDTVRHVTAADRGKGYSRERGYTADALVTDTPGISLMVFSADCVILLLHDPVTGSIGAVHAGWRGTVLDLPVKTVGEMGRLFGAKPENIRVAIGAAIGPCCFETHDDVPSAMRRAFGAAVEEQIRPVGEKWSVDLKRINAQRLEQAGILPPHMDISPLCTACHPELYWSHRKLGDRRGVQGALIALREERQ